MNTYEFVTIAIAITSILVSVILTTRSIRASNKSTRLLSKVMRENSRMTTSDHLSLYRTEAFYNFTIIKNLELEIQNVQQRINSAPDKDKEELDVKLKQLRMNLHYMKIRETQLMQGDFTLQQDLSELFKEYKIN